MPSTWAGFDALRTHRGVRYAVHVARTGPGNEARPEVDGQAVAGTTIPLSPAGTEEVRVVRVG